MAKDFAFSPPKTIGEALKRDRLGYEHDTGMRRKVWPVGVAKEEEDRGMIGLNVKSASPGEGHQIMIEHPNSKLEHPYFEWKTKKRMKK